MYYSIEFLRIIFTIIVILYHFVRQMGISNNGGYAVEFFFIVSGVFLFQHLQKHKTENLITFAMDKIKRFLPYIVLAILFRVFYKLYIGGHINITPILNNLTFMPMANSLCSVVAWYINILLWVSVFIFILHHACKQKHINLTLGILAFISFYILQQNDFPTFTRLGTKGDFGFFIEDSILRGLCGIGAGYLLAQCIKLPAIKVNKLSHICWSIVEAGLLIYTVGAMMVPSWYFGAKFIYLSTLGMVWVFLSNKGFLSRSLNRSVWGKVTPFILPIYLCQEIIVSDLFPKLWKQYPIIHDYPICTICITTLTVCILGIMAYCLVTLLQKCFRRLATLIKQ